LVYHSVEIKKTHDIIFLLSKCSNFDFIFSTIDPLNINAFAIRARYPNFNMPEVEEARALYQLAIHVNRIVKEKIVFCLITGCKYSGIAYKPEENAREK